MTPVTELERGNGERDRMTTMRGPLAHVWRSPLDGSPYGSLQLMILLLADFDK